jgi:20S proteasome alpha/beta subunit
MPIDDAVLEARYEHYKDDFGEMPKEEAIEILRKNLQADAERDIYAEKKAAAEREAAK